MKLKNIKFVLLSIMFIFLGTSTLSAHESCNCEIVPKDKMWTITFNSPVRLSDLYSEFYILDVEDNYKIYTNLNFVDYKLRQVCVQAPRKGYEYGKCYQLVVSNNLKSIDGVRIKEEYIKNFKIEIPAQLTSSSYVNNFLFSHNPEYTTELIVDNNKLILNNIPSDDIFKYLMVKLYSINEDGSKNYIHDEIHNTRKKNGMNYIELPISNLKDDNYVLDIYTSRDRYSMFNSWIYDFSLSSKNNILEIPLSPVYDLNKKIFDANVMEDSYLSMSFIDHEDITSLKNLATTITKGLNNDYSKALAIYEWICKNIYYDYDALYSGDIGNYGSIETLELKRGVCHDYATLLRDLMRASNIPCKYVSGYALGGNRGEKWHSDIIKYNDSNHAWNEIYINGRWIILDSTWDSNNRYQNGKFNSAKMDYSYFDPTLEFFSNTHKIQI